MAELADQLVVTPSGVTRRGAPRVRGLVERSVIEHDARGIHAELTIAGSRVFDAPSETDVDGLRRLFFDKLDPMDLAYLNEIGSRVGQHSGRDPGAPLRAVTRDHLPASE